VGVEWVSWGPAREKHAESAGPMATFSLPRPSNRYRSKHFSHVRSAGAPQAGCRSGQDEVWFNMHRPACPDVDETQRGRPAERGGRFVDTMCRFW